ARAWPPNAPRATAAACVCVARVAADPAAAPGGRGLRRWRPPGGRSRGVTLTRLLVDLLAMRSPLSPDGESEAMPSGRPAGENQDFRKRGRGVLRWAAPVQRAALRDLLATMLADHGRCRSDAPLTHRGRG